MCLSAQASREVCSLPPMASTITSACLATFTASAICLRSSSGIARHDFVLIPGAADGDLAAFAVEHLDTAAGLRLDAFEHGDVVLWACRCSRPADCGGRWDR